MVAHNAQSIEAKLIFLLALLNGIKQNCPTFSASETKFSIVAAQGNVVTTIGLETPW
jgi:hypothetical protein